ncbi:MAG: EF-Tu/IF-2/RF-3 family GTPase [Nanoarchaeota archaeon]
MAEEKEIGEIFSFYSDIDVAAIKLKGKLKEGDKIRVKGHTTDFEQKVGSMQIEHEKVKEAKKGDQVGIKVDDKVRKHDKVYLVK